MKPPVSRRFFGDVEKAASYIKESDIQMAIMENDMRFMGLAQYKRTVVIENGVVIICTSNHNIRKIIIYHPTVEDLTIYKRYLRCFCNCPFAIGIVIGPSESVYNESYPSKDLRLDVIVCNKESKFIRFNDCLGSDFTRYTTIDGETIPPEDQYGTEEGWGFDERPWEGDPVILMLDSGRPGEDYLSCCSSYVYAERINNGEKIYEACSPVNTPNGLYPTYRVIPLVSISMPRIIDSWVEAAGKKRTVINYG